MSVQGVHGDALFTVSQRDTRKRAVCVWCCTLYGVTKRDKQACSVCMVLYSLRCHKERQVSVEGVHGDALFTVSQRETNKRAACAW